MARVSNTCLSTALRAPARRKEPPAKAFDANRHRNELLGIAREIADLTSTTPPGVLSDADLKPILKRHARDGNAIFSRSQLISGIRQLSEAGALPQPADELVARVRMRPVRTRSGITPVTVLTKPFPCPGQCVFCPNDVRMPKSYLSDEPGAQRAEDNAFDPYLQTWNRLDVFRSIGHPTDKVELIVLGGTWSSYPEPYQRWFIKRCFDALNDFGAGVDGRSGVETHRFRFGELPRHVRSDRHASVYNEIVTAFLKHNQGDLLAPAEDCDWSALRAAHAANERAGARCVGLSLETRPDHVTRRETIHLRRLGCTKLQLGVQSLDDDVLAANKRGHRVAETREAFRLLRSAGFKIHAHWMPNLLGSSTARDRIDYLRLFDDPAFRPDELKIYPCSLIESAELMHFYERGQWEPYSEDALVALLEFVFESTPRYCRLTRVIRDIPAGDIVTGVRRNNLREEAERRLAARGGQTLEIRAREVRSREVQAAELSMRTSEFETAIGAEQFIEYVTSDDRIAAFLRLSLPRSASHIDELQGRALIREVHVYGAAQALGERTAGAAQHMGLGARLIDQACKRAAALGFSGIAVISAVGTREYYRKLGFTDGDLYQHRTWRDMP